MATLNFPSSPANNQTYTVGSKTWTWNGYAWEILRSAVINQQNTDITIIQGVNTTQNTNIQAAFNKANTGSSNVVSTSGNVYISAPAGAVNVSNVALGLVLPTGNTTQRPSSNNSIGGSLRWNSDTNQLEVFKSSTSLWHSVSISTRPAGGPYAGMVTDGLLAAIDAGVPASYLNATVNGTTIYDLTDNAADATMAGSVAWVSNGTASYFNWPSRSDSNYISSSKNQSYVDFTAIIYLYDTGPHYILESGYSNDKGLRLFESGGNPAIDNASGGGDDWAQNQTTYYKNGVGTTSDVLLTTNTWYVLGGAKNTSGIGSSWQYWLGTGYTNRHLSGRIGVMYLYNRQLTAAEQLQNYQVLAARYGI
jgi:hypothetical protein